MEIPKWIINPYDKIEESDMLQEELTGLSTNDELKVQFKKGISAITASKKHTCYLSYIMEFHTKVFDSFSIFVPRGKWFQHSSQYSYKIKKQIRNYWPRIFKIKPD